MPQKKRRLGRPPLPRDQLKQSKVISIRLPVESIAKYYEKCDITGLNVRELFELTWQKAWKSKI